VWACCFKTLGYLPTKNTKIHSNDERWSVALKQTCLWIEFVPFHSWHFPKCYFLYLIKSEVWTVWIQIRRIEQIKRIVQGRLISMQLFQNSNRMTIARIFFSWYLFFVQNAFRTRIDNYPIQKHTFKSNKGYFLFKFYNSHNFNAIMVIIILCSIDIIWIWCAINIFIRVHLNMSMVTVIYYYPGWGCLVDFFTIRG